MPIFGHTHQTSSLRSSLIDWGIEIFKIWPPFFWSPRSKSRRNSILNRFRKCHATILKTYWVISILIRSILRISQTETILFIFGVLFALVSTFNKYRDITYRDCVVYAYLSYKVRFIQKYWYFTNLWANIYKFGAYAQIWAYRFGS